MNRSQPQFQRLFLMFLVSLFFHFHTSYSDVGTAALYSPPYSPTACYRSDASQFPSCNLFAAAGDGIWNDGAACGRLYLVRCITSTSTPYTCNQNQTIQIKIVGYIDRAPFAHSTYKATMVLSNTAFGTIVNSSTVSSYTNIEFKQVHGEDVPLTRGPISPSAPNPTTNDQRGHYKVHGEDVVPLTRGPVSPSAPNPATDDRRSHYKVHGEDVVPLARGLVSPSALNPTTDDRWGHYKVHGENVSLARGPVSPSAPNPTTDDRRGHYKVHGEDVPLARGPVSPSAPNPTTND